MEGEVDGRNDTDAMGPTITPAGGAGGRALRVRARVRQYELIREIGHGGMGTVYLARDTKLARRVAIKFLSHPSPDFAERFLVEARATARCSHENIVVIHEVDELEGQPYMVLEYLDGRPLSRILSEASLSRSRAIEIAVPVVQALAHAHGFGIVHRDLKPDNIFVTDAGNVKVLDFGIAKLFETDGDSPARAVATDADPASLLTQQSALVGTLPYMSPEQWGADAVDHRTDLWALGVVVYEMIAGRHPLAPVTRDRLLEAATRLDDPMPRLADAVADVPAQLDELVGRCLAKRKADRFEDAAALLTALEPLAPRRRVAANAESSPYPGLNAFREEDADLFYGRDAEIARVAARVRDRPLLGVVGPSGVGKSSFVRAGLIPELKHGEHWDTVVTRPGRHPLDSLAASALALSSRPDARADDIDQQELAARFRSEPGALGAMLRKRANARGSRALLFVDQLEELFALVDDAELRAAYLTCLLGAADDPMSPVRVVVAMRSDFLDRVAEHDAFIDALTPGLTFLAPPTADGLRAALVEPAAAVGYRFEDEAIATDMVDELATTPGALPLLQFAVGRLWDERDRRRRLLTADVYERIGGVTGAIASHADAVIAGFAPPAQKLARQVFERLVTPDRTRDVVAMDDLVALSSDEAAVRRLIDHLVDARLLVVRAETGDVGVEIVHESLIERWPTLRGWLDRNQKDAAALARLRMAAKQWAEAGRPDGLLWRDDAVRQARAWLGEYGGELAGREREFLDAAFRVADRAARAKRTAVAGAFALLTLLVVAAAIALVWIRDAERDARSERDRAVAETERTRQAQAETEAANDELEQERRRQAELLDKLQREQAARERASSEAEAANRQVRRSDADLQRANEKLLRALDKAKQESERARIEAERAKAERQRADEASKKFEELYRKERDRNDRLEKQTGKIPRILK